MSRTLGNQRGGALIVVMMVGMVIAIGFAGFITSSLLVEARAVEGSLARSRAYWAQMGNFNYALSRVSKSKLCNSCLVSFAGNRDTDLAPVLQRRGLSVERGQLREIHIQSDGILVPFDPLRRFDENQAGAHYCAICGHQMLLCAIIYPSH